MPGINDVVIVGAGPSGSRLAFSLAGRGHHVLVLDRKGAAGEDVCCTGIVSDECVEEFGIDHRLIIRRASSARFISPSGGSLRLRREDGVAAILDRPALDRALAGQAQGVGAEYHFNTAVTGLKEDTGRVRVMVNRGGEEAVYEARAAVLATGFGSPLPGRLGLGNIDYVIIGAQASVETSGVAEVEVYLDQSLAPGGFAWLVPHTDSTGLAGLMTRRQPERYLDGLLARLQAQGKIAATDVEKSYSAIPRRPLPRSVTDRILVVGEAAGQVKPATGGGIYYGLLAADIAADCLDAAIRADDFSVTRLSSYERRWRARLGGELRKGYWLCRFYERLNNGHIEGLFRLAERAGVARFVAELETLPFDEHGRLFVGLLKHLAVKAPLPVARAIIKAARTGRRSPS